MPSIKLRRALPLVLCLGLSLGPGCKQQHSDHDGHDHGVSSDGHAHEDPGTGQITIWTEQFEVFAEYPPIVAGKAAQLTTHVSDLRTHEPLAGPVTFLLQSGTETALEHVEPGPARPGIYLPKLTFPRAGEWKVTVVIPATNGSASVEMPGIRIYADDHAAAHAEFPEAPEGVGFTKEQQWKLKMTTAPAGERKLVQRTIVTGMTQPKPGFSATVIAPVAGQVLPPGEGGFPIPGTRVKEGQLLARLKPAFSELAGSIVQAEAAFAEATAAVEQARLAYERTRELHAAEAKSQRELQEAEAALALARSRLAATAALRSTYKQAGLAPTNAEAGQLPALELRAPISGTVTTTATGPGEMAVAEQQLFKLLNPDVLWIQANVPEARFSRLAQARGAAFTLPGSADSYTDVLASGGKLIFAGNQVDPVTRTVALTYELPNPEGRLLAGQALTLHVETAMAEQALAIPTSALVDQGGRPVAYVQLAGETFEKRELVTGIQDGPWIQVISGLKAGERVVTQGAFAIRLASMSNALPAHGHAH